MKTILDDMECTRSENEELKENIKEANTCISKLREQIWKFKARHKEVNHELKESKENVVNLKLQLDECKKIKEFLKDNIKQKMEEWKKTEENYKDTIKQKTEKNEKLYQELRKLR